MAARITEVSDDVSLAVTLSRGGVTGGPRLSAVSVADTLRTPRSTAVLTGAAVTLRTPR